VEKLRFCALIASRVRQWDPVRDGQRFEVFSPGDHQTAFRRVSRSGTTLEGMGSQVVSTTRAAGKLLLDGGSRRTGAETITTMIMTGTLVVTVLLGARPEWPSQAGGG
jgi:hypothetical protein